MDPRDISLSLFFLIPFVLSLLSLLSPFIHSSITGPPIVPRESLCRFYSFPLSVCARARRLTSRARCLLDFRWQRHVERSSPFCFLSATGCSPMRPSAQGNTIAFKDLLSPPTYYFYSFSVGSQLLGVIASAFSFALAFRLFFLVSFFTQTSYLFSRPRPLPFSLLSSRFFLRV